MTSSSLHGSHSGISLSGGSLHTAQQAPQGPFSSSWMSETSSTTFRTTQTTETVTTVNSENFCARAEKALQQVDEDDDGVMKLRPAPFVGRDREMADLNAALDPLTTSADTDSCPKVLCIEGAPGSGKSTLAQQLRPRVLESHGYFLQGKFDEKGQLPYNGLAMAMEDFANQMIERDYDMSIRRRLREFLQGNETILLDVFPGLHTLILGSDSAEARPKMEQQQPSSSRTSLDASAARRATLRSDKEEGAQRSKRRVFFFQQFFHAVLTEKKYQDDDVDPTEWSEPMQEERPPCIVLVLDDVQWADKSSLDLISSLVRDPDLNSFLLVATSRPVDDPDHVWKKQIKSWMSERVSIQHYPLENLCITSMETIVAHCLDCGDQNSNLDEDDSDNTNQSKLIFPLAQIVHQRTQGNPFFAVEFLKALVDRQLLHFSYATMTWKWDLEKVHSLVLTMTDSPVDLLIAKAKRLPPNQQLILLISSCLGGTFKAKLIRKVVKSLWAQNKQSDTTQDNSKPCALLTQHATKDLPILDTLEGFVYNGFMDRSGTSFFFVHDLIRQAAMEFVSHQEMEWMRLCVGECILQGMMRLQPPQPPQPPQQEAPQQIESKESNNTNNYRNEANLFLGVDLCNSAAHLFPTNNNQHDNTAADGNHKRNNPLSLVDLARFNCRAGEKAMGESAFLQAVGYLKTGIRLLQHSNEPQDEALLANLVALAAEASYCSGNYEDMNTYAEQVLARSDCPEETRVKMLLFRVHAAQAQDFASEALDIGYGALELLGMATFPRYPKPYHVVIELLKTKKALRNHTQRSLVELPIVSDPRREAAMEFLNSMKGPAAVSNQDFLIVTFLKSIRWAVKYGLGKHSPGGFSIYGTILLALFGEKQNAIMYGEVALALADRMDIQETTAETSTLTFGMLRHWTRDMRSCYAPLVYAQKLAAEVGDCETVTFCLIFGSCVKWCTAMVSLPTMGRDLQRSCAICRDYKHWSMLEILMNLGIHLRRLCCGKDDNSFAWLDDPSEASSQRGSVASDTPNKLTAKTSDPTIELFYECMALQSHYLLDERTSSLKCAAMTSTMGTELCIGQSYVPRTQFYRALVYLAIPRNGKGISWSHSREAKRALSLLKRWNKNGNSNCLHMVHLVEAEFARTRKQNSKARELYVEAIRAAEFSGHIQDAGTGHECAAIFFLTNLNDMVRAASHIGQAVRLYKSWGASAVVRRIEQTYKELLSMGSGTAKFFRGDCNA